MKRNQITRILLLLALTILLAVLFTGCIPQAGGAMGKPAGFFSGIWHGWIAPLSLILSPFTGAQIYEVNNTGFFYDLGFYMAVISGFGGLAFHRKHKRRRDDD